MKLPLYREGIDDRPSRFALLSWVNELLGADYIRLEQLADGIAYCHLLSVVQPTAASLLFKLNLGAETVCDCRRNLRAVEEVVRKLNLPIEFDSEKLSKGKMLDHFKVLSSLYHYFNITTTKAQAAGGDGTSGAASTKRSCGDGTAAVVGKKNNSVICAKLSKETPADEMGVAGEMAVGDEIVVGDEMRLGDEMVVGDEMRLGDEMVVKLTQQVQRRVRGVMEAASEVEEVESEALFYFDKLKFIEEIVRSSTATGLADAVSKILADKPQQF
eukprot:GHVS01027398.1.p1 GENE.GHVS01027398.1~~GHVS01027398.1.p1  ORF type:complete len:293 (+),score=94.89 GHVS01027398.1:66-881(+)